MKGIIFILLLIPFNAMFLGCEKLPPDNENPIPEITDYYYESPNNDFKDASVCAVNLIASQQINVGLVTTTFNNEGDQVTIAYSLTMPGWCLIETHLDVQIDPDNFPMTQTGNPKVGQFEYGEELECSLSWEQIVDLSTVEGWTEGMTIYIAAHASLQMEPFGQETAWGEGEDFPGNNWAMYFSCEPPQWTCGDVLIDERDGRSYNTVQIGDQCWMAENLNVGTKINSTTGGFQQTDNDVIEKYCYNNNEANCDVYGGLYEWPEAMQYVTTEGAQGICPEGFHIPTDGEWTTMTNYLGGSTIAGGKMKSIGTIQDGTGLWYAPNSGATNESGFTGLPGGGRYREDGSFSYLGFYGSFRSSSQFSTDYAWNRYLYYFGANVGRYDDTQGYGFSVRCLKDQP